MEEEGPSEARNNLQSSYGLRRPKGRRRPPNIRHLRDRPAKKRNRLQWYRGTSTTRNGRHKKQTVLGVSRFLIIKKRTPSDFAEVLNKERMASGPFFMDQKHIGFVIAHPHRRMELANSRAENHANISRTKQGLEWCKC